MRSGRLIFSVLIVLAFACGPAANPAAAQSFLNLLKKKEEQNYKSSKKSNIEVYNSSSQSIESAQPLFMKKIDGMSSAKPDPKPFTSYQAGSAQKYKGLSSIELSKMDTLNMQADAAEYNSKVEKVAALNAAYNDKLVAEMQTELDRKIARALESQANAQQAGGAPPKKEKTVLKYGDNTIMKVEEENVKKVYRKKEASGIGEAHEPIRIFKNFR